MTEILSRQLQRELRQMEAQKQGSYDKRTEHLDEQGSSLFINRLILEDSPYLLQHAHNPVNWYPWGEEAFADAKEQSKPIFLSIGYSTCHWCHVMEVESFDNLQVAEILNANFISIKLDREQYPDIDEIYMTGVQLMSGQGGWPMSNFLMSDGKPFFAATYFPPARFIGLLQQINKAWTEQADELKSTATKISEAIDQILAERKNADSLHPQIVESTVQALLQREDRSQGGLAGQPKFPQEPLLLLLLDQVWRKRDLDAMGFIDRALHGMAEGGIYDQVAGGFHRYSVDAQWLVPHFEKMLYNQSQLGLVYLQAYQLTGKAYFRRVCEQILDYVLRDMQLSDGGFYSATDADSEGREGTFFTWTPAELKAALDSSELEFVSTLFGASEQGNFEGSNILCLSRPLAESAAEFEGDDFYAQLDAVLNKLYHAREERVHPLRDDKLIIAWSAAMTNTLAKAAYCLGRKDWLQAAERASQIMWGQNFSKNGELKRIYLDGTVSITGQLEDYAHFIEALITLFDVSNNSLYLNQAVQLMDVALKQFWDEQAGGFYLSPARQTGPQLTRSRSAGDGATLSAVAVALQCLLGLARRSQLVEGSLSRDELAYETKIDACIASVTAHVNDNPLSHSSALRAIMDRQQGSLDPIQYSHGGRARITLNRAGAAGEDRIQLQCNITLQPGWHVTASQQSEGELYPLQLDLAEEESDWQVLNCRYPEAVGKLQCSDGSSIVIYEKDLVIELELQRASNEKDVLSASVGVSLSLQLCDENSCLLPQALHFRI